MSNRLDPDQARRLVGPDLDPICLQGFSANNNTRRQRVKSKNILDTLDSLRSEVQFTNYTCIPYRFAIKVYAVGTELFACWVFFMQCCCLLTFLKLTFSRNFFRNSIRVSFFFVALHLKSTALFMAGPSFHLTTLFPGQA